VAFLFAEEEEEEVKIPALLKTKEEWNAAATW
jgi:hypothetical protein